MKRTYTSDDVLALRNRAGMTQQDFAYELGASVRSIARWEKTATPGRMAQRALADFERELDEREPPNPSSTPATSEH